MILFKRQIDIFYLFISFIDFSINRILCFLFSAYDSTTVQYKNIYIQKKKLALKDISIPLF